VDAGQLGVGRRAQAALLDLAVVHQEAYLHHAENGFCQPCTSCMRSAVSGQRPADSRVERSTRPAAGKAAGSSGGTAEQMY